MPNWGTEADSTAGAQNLDGEEDGVKRGNRKRRDLLAKGSPSLSENLLGGQIRRLTQCHCHRSPDVPALVHLPDVLCNPGQVT